MLSKTQIQGLFEKLNQALAAKGEVGEVLLVGGAVMCLVYNTRQSTKDVDAIFEPATTIRLLVAQIAEQEGLAPDWLNDAVKGFIEPNFQQENIINLPNLRVYVPEPRYLLAMKCISARWDTSDKDDVIFLIQFLKISKAKEVLSLIENYYPKKLIPAKTQFFIEELFSE